MAFDPGVADNRGVDPALRQLSRAAAGQLHEGGARYASGGDKEDRLPSISTGL